MRQNVLILLCPFDRKAGFLEKARFIAALTVIALQRLEVAINAHQSCASSNVAFIVKTSDKIQQSFFRRFRTHIK